MNFFSKNCIYGIVIAFILGFVSSYYVFKQKNIGETIHQVQTIEIVKHDTVNVEKIVPIEKIKYITIHDTTFLNNINSNEIDSLYKNFADQIKQGNIPTVEDTIHFGKHFLQTKYKFPPLSKFEYTFKAGDDSIITNTITKTKIIDTTPKLSFYAGIVSQLNSNDGSLNNFGLTLGTKYKRIGIQTNIFQRSKYVGLNYYWPK